jgi:hypothetical protein
MANVQANVKELIQSSFMDLLSDELWDGLVAQLFGVGTAYVVNYRRNNTPRF